MTTRIFTLIKKDLLLSECYVFLAGVILIAFPLFTNCTVKGFMSSDYFLFITIDFAAFLIFNQIYMMESKNRGISSVMASPYTKSEIILSRYILLVIICLAGAWCYKILELINPAYIFSGVPGITFAQIVFSVSWVLMCYDLLMPMLNFFPYEKVKFIFVLVSVLMPLWGSLLVKYLLNLNDITISMIPINNNDALIVIIMDTVLFLISFGVSRHLWEKKEF